MLTDVHGYSVLFDGVVPYLAVPLILPTSMPLEFWQPVAFSPKERAALEAPCGFSGTLSDGMHWA